MGYPVMNKSVPLISSIALFLSYKRNDCPKVKEKPSASSSKGTGAGSTPEKSSPLLDGYLAGFRTFTFWELNQQHPIREAGFGLIMIDVRG